MVNKHVPTINHVVQLPVNEIFHNEYKSNEIKSTPTLEYHSIQSIQLKTHFARGYAEPKLNYNTLSMASWIDSDMACELVSRRTAISGVQEYIGVSYYDWIIKKQERVSEKALPLNQTVKPYQYRAYILPVHGTT